MPSLDDAAATQLVIAAIAAEFRIDPARLTAATEWRDVPGWTSISHVMLILRLEQMRGIELDPDALQSCLSVATLARAIAAA